MMRFPALVFTGNSLSVSRRMKSVVCLFVLALFQGSAFAKQKEEAKAPLPDATLAEVRFGEVVNEAPFNKDELTGKVVVVEVWGVNCPPCIASLPELAKLAKTYEKKGLAVVGLECQGSKKEDILKVLKSAKVKYPVMAGGSAPGIKGGIPYACVFDRGGKLVWNGNPHDENFERAVKKELRRPAR